MTELKRLQLRIKELELDVLNLARDLRLAQENETLLVKYIRELEQKIQAKEADKANFRTRDR